MSMTRSERLALLFVGTLAGGALLLVFAVLPLVSSYHTQTLHLVMILSWIAGGLMAIAFVAWDTRRDLPHEPLARHAGPVD